MKKIIQIVTIPLSESDEVKLSTSDSNLTIRVLGLSDEGDVYEMILRKGDDLHSWYQLSVGLED